jgi:hypothetical protein
MATTETRQSRADPAPLPELIVYSHSWLLYWWPAWVIGYVMALLTWLHPVEAQIDGTRDLFFPGNDLGVIYALVLLLLIVLTNTSMRGYASTVVAVTVAFLILLFAYLHWWDHILAWFGDQSVHLNLGFFLFFSTGLLLLWLVVVFGFDRLNFWRIRPGQVTHEYLLGVIDRSYDTDAVVFTKQQGDLFRHWVLGLGSGDLQIQTVGGLGREVTIPNVLFVNVKVARILDLVATKPEVAGRP